MINMTKGEQEVFNEIMVHGRVVCLFAIDQPLVDQVCNIIKEQQSELLKLRSNSNDSKTTESTGNMDSSSDKL